jgi:osmoprotectant transport system permease protein
VAQLLALMESGATKRRRWRIVVGLVVLIGGVVAAQATRTVDRQDAYVIGAKNFSEQFILAEVIAQRLAAANLTSTQSIGLGSTVAFQALVNNDIDVYVDYSGTVWANIMKRTDAPSREQVLLETRQWLAVEYGVEMLGSLGFENAYALAMRRDRADELGIRSIADLGTHARQLRIGADLEFLSRPEWTALREGYGLNFAGQRQFQPTFMYKAVADREVDVISAFSSDGRIAANDLVVLTDPKQVILPYDAIVLIAPKRKNDTALRPVLQPLIGAIAIERMREANFSVDREADKQTPAQAATWLIKTLD